MCRRVRLGKSICSNNLTNWVASPIFNSEIKGYFNNINEDEAQEWSEATVTRLFVGEIEEVINDLENMNNVPLSTVYRSVDKSNQGYLVLHPICSLSLL